MSWKQRVKWTQTVAFWSGIKRRPTICGGWSAVVLPFGALQEEIR